MVSSPQGGIRYAVTGPTVAVGPIVLSPGHMHDGRGASESVDVLVIDYDRHNSTEQAMVEFGVFDTRGLTAIVQDEQFLNHWADS